LNLSQIASRKLHKQQSVFHRYAFRATPIAGQNIQRMSWENLGAVPPVYRFPPNPAVIDRMHETMRWVQWLEEEPPSDLDAGQAL
jgi:hypothetical protein